MTFPTAKFEDALLRAYWQRQGRAGWWFLELPVGDGMAAAGSRRSRRFDAVVLPGSRPRVSTSLVELEQFGHEVVGSKVELVEAKRQLNTAVIGQLLCGLPMFSAAYPAHGAITLTALVHRASDAALRWYCDTERIQVVEVEPDWTSTE